MSNRGLYKKLEVIYELMELATVNKDWLHVSLIFSGHVNGLDIRVAPIDTDYSELNREELFKSYFYLDDKDALKKLNEAKKKIMVLITEAKAMGAV